MLLFMTGFSSCQKDSFKQVNQTSVGSKDKLRVAATNPGTYSELTLLARQPGETFDTYVGNWGGVSIKMQATPTWNHDQYPNLVNGVPCTGGGYTVGDLNQIATSTAGGQDFFIVGVATATFTARQLFNSDVTTYINAWILIFNHIHPAQQYLRHQVTSKLHIATAIQPLALFRYQEN